MQEIEEREEERQLMSQYTVAPSRQQESTDRHSASGFCVRDAPWSSGKQQQPSLTDDAEFPTIGISKPSSGSVAWGPRKKAY